MKKKSTRCTKILHNNKNNHEDDNPDTYSRTEVWNKNQQLQGKKLINLKMSWEVLKHLSGIEIYKRIKTTKLDFILVSKTVFSSMKSPTSTQFRNRITNTWIYQRKHK